MVSIRCEVGEDMEGNMQAWLPETDYPPRCVELGDGRFVLILSEERYVFCDRGEHYTEYVVPGARLTGIHSGKWMGQHLWGAWRGASEVIVINENRVVAQSTLLLPRQCTLIPQGTVMLQGKPFAVGHLFCNSKRGVIAVETGEKKVTVSPEQVVWLPGTGGMVYVDNPSAEPVYLIEEEGKYFLYTFHFPDGTAQVRQKIELPDTPCLFSVSPNADYLALDGEREGIQIYNCNTEKVVAVSEEEEVEWCGGWAIAFTRFTPRCDVLNLATPVRRKGSYLFGNILGVIGVSDTQVAVASMLNHLCIVGVYTPHELLLLLTTNQK